MALIFKKILRNPEAQFPKVSVLAGQNRYHVIITFKILKIEFKLEHAR